MEKRKRIADQTRRLIHKLKLRWGEFSVTPRYGVFIAFLTAIVFWGCAHTPPAPSTHDSESKSIVPPPDRSLVYLYRDELFGAAIPMTVFIDGQLAGKTGPFTYFLWDLPPGKHTIKSVAENESTITLITKPGNVHYVRQEVKMGMVTMRSTLYEVDENTGKNAINKCRLLTSMVFDAIQIAHGSESIEKKPSIIASTPDKEMEKPIDTVTSSSGLVAASTDRIPTEVKRQGYTLEFEPVFWSLRKDDLESAIKYADILYRKTELKDGPKQNRYLTLLERGKIALMACKYDQAIADLQEAERRFLTIEGTIPVIEGFGSLLTDDTTMEYEAEMHEKLMISPYLVLAYLGKGDFDGARVERNRTITKINQYIEDKPTERSYLENPFARCLAALIYEMEGKFDDAKIEYSKLKWYHEVERLEKGKGKSTDLVIFIETGLAPHKYEKTWGPQKIPTPQGTITLGFAYAGYAPIHSEVKSSFIYMDGQPLGEAQLLYDLEKTVISQYENNKTSLEQKLVARMTAKALAQIGAKMAAKEALKNVPLASLFADIAIDAAAEAWLAVEHADLRGWLSLPKKIHFIRVNDIASGVHEIKVDYGIHIQTRRINIEKGKINIVYFAFGG